MKRLIELRVNGEVYPVAVEPRETLLHVLREKLGLTGTKQGCGVGECGACSVLMGGRVVNACLVLAVEAAGEEITTIEGLASSPEAAHPLQRAFVEHGALQCGFCTPGMIMTAKALLDENPDPTEEEVKEALAGNVCRCTGYTRIVHAVLAAAEMRRNGERA